VSAPREVAFEVAGIPAPQGSMRAIISRTTGRAFAKHDNANTKPWRSLVALTAARHRPSPLFEGAVTLTVRFYLPRPKSLPKRVVCHAKKPDLSKLVRALEDALSGVIWHDDAQVAMVVATKHYGDPGCTVVVREVGS